MLPGNGTPEHSLVSRRPLLRARTNLEDEVLGPTESNLTLETMYRRMKVIRGQENLPQRERTRLLNELTKQFVLVFNTRDYAEDYETLKKEVKFLAALTRYSFLHMAKRLITIRDNRLFRKDGYATFKDFIEGEIPLSRSTVYNYIDIVTFFGVQPVGQTFEIEYSKLLPALPLLKANNGQIPKEEIKQHFLEGAETKTRSQLAQEARNYKREYGLVREKKVRLSAVFRYVQENVPAKPNEQEKRIIRRMVEYLRRIGTQ
jgi:hypothetical protein